MKNKTDEIVRRRIIDLRESKDWSQSELARRVKLDNSKISKIESGIRKVSATELDLFAKTFDVSTDYLVGNTDNPNSADDDMNTVDLDKALSEEGMAMFDGQPLSEEYKKALLTMLRAEKRGE
ncbi:helix-turn-helix domain-containing protein [Pediococcus pentosaceus]|uniref:helix-turn-helix domain-containing protein n=1 Tax=Pediococcus pentosaceus TaxID=1255 RepID=UPI0018A18A0D|nr:helix-turn-helix domain-containing protein [Pediococcus pentosaceus]MBF7109928.1 helix-turn-helix domain-containing protein [Pediococcus pentosaceus]MBF7122074.1 helix-turn-helix domain-containing protein [Pediococcus pentosaceus]QQA91597.1 helix-turn-helix domain-containing protein [Pediococcus pentosaceus]